MLEAYAGNGGFLRITKSSSISPPITVQFSAGGPHGRFAVSGGKEEGGWESKGLSGHAG